MDELRDRVERFVREHDLIPAGGEVTCLVSGGADSTCLWHLLGALGYRVSALHVDHGLRGADSEDDAIHFKAEASAWTPRAVQLQQVWVDPRLRGRGHARRGMRDLCRLLLQTTPLVCLFARPENLPALRLYDSIGMRRVMSYRSVLF